MSVIEEAPPEKKSSLENWSSNERMRHVPATTAMLQKLDGELRRRIALLLAPVATIGVDDPRRAGIDMALRALCTGLERVAEVARQNRSGGNGHAPQEIVAKVQWDLENAVSCLRSADPDLVGRRYPVHTFERSKAEPLYGGLLRTIDAIERLTQVVRAIDPRIDERLYEPLVSLQHPMDSRPIA
jgi:hypothetical protein